MDCLVDAQRHWLDIGCGRAPFPNNLQLSATLAERCPRLVGIDPDASVGANEYVHEGRQATLEQYFPDRPFDLVSARMVVEHVHRPDEFTASLRRVTSAEALVVFYTVNWWSISALAAHCSPMAVHHWTKKGLWETKEDDTFPTVYRMNRRSTLRTLMHCAGFEECMFEVLPDAGLLWRLPVLRRIELACFRALRAYRLPYVDSNLLAVYRRVE